MEVRTALIVSIRLLIKLTGIVWYYAVANWGNPNALGISVWSYLGQLFPGQLEVWMVQIFFVYRIYICEPILGYPLLAI
jgi:hypothetical protein